MELLEGDEGNVGDRAETEGVESADDRPTFEGSIPRIVEVVEPAVSFSQFVGGRSTGPEGFEQEVIPLVVEPEVETIDQAHLDEIARNFEALDLERQTQQAAIEMLEVGMPPEPIRPGNKFKPGGVVNTAIKKIWKDADANIVSGLAGLQAGDKIWINDSVGQNTTTQAIAIAETVDPNGVTTVFSGDPLDDALAGPLQVHLKPSEMQMLPSLSPDAAAAFMQKKRSEAIETRKAAKNESKKSFLLRSDEDTVAALNKLAEINGVSANHLLNQVVKAHLDQNQATLAGADHEWPLSDHHEFEIRLRFELTIEEDQIAEVAPKIAGNLETVLQAHGADTINVKWGNPAPEMWTVSHVNPDAWASPSSDPIGDIKKWTDIFGVNPNHFWIEGSTQRKVVRSKDPWGWQMSVNLNTSGESTFWLHKIEQLDIPHKGLSWVAVGKQGDRYAIPDSVAHFIGMNNYPEGSSGHVLVEEWRSPF